MGSLKFDWGEASKKQGIFSPVLSRKGDVKVSLFFLKATMSGQEKTWLVAEPVEGETDQYMVRRHYYVNKGISERSKYKSKTFAASRVFSYEEVYELMKAFPKRMVETGYAIDDDQPFEALQPEVMKNKPLAKVLPFYKN